jgi:predicted transcriptional regulator
VFLGGSSRLTPSKVVVKQGQIADGRLKGAARAATLWWKGIPVTITIRLNPVAEAALREISRLAGKPLAELVGQAIADFVARESARVADNDVTAEDLQAYWERDPDLEIAIEEFVRGETSGYEDRLEGVLVEITQPALQT